MEFNIPDVTKVIFDVLTEEYTDLYDLVETNIWSPNPPPSTLWKNETPAIIYHSASERGLDGFFDARINFRCYGGSNKHEDARNTYLKLYERLNEANEYGLIMAVHDTATVNITESGTRFPLAIATYQCKVT